VWIWTYSSSAVAFLVKMNFSLQVPVFNLVVITTAIPLLLLPEYSFLAAVNKTTSQSLWPRINSLMKTARSAVLRFFFWRRQPRYYGKVTLVAVAESISGFWGRCFWLLKSLQKEVF